jgi:hypothetical protein
MAEFSRKQGRVLPLVFTLPLEETDSQARSRVGEPPLRFSPGVGHDIFRISTSNATLLLPRASPGSAHRTTRPRPNSCLWSRGTPEYRKVWNPGWNNSTREAQLRFVFQERAAGPSSHRPDHAGSAATQPGKHPRRSEIARHDCVGGASREQLRGEKSRFDSTRLHTITG